MSDYELKKHVFADSFYGGLSKDDKSLIEDPKVISTIEAHLGYFEISDNNLLEDFENLGLKVFEQRYDGSKEEQNEARCRYVFVMNEFLGRKVRNFCFKVSTILGLSERFQSALFSTLQESFPTSTLQEKVLFERFLKHDGYVDENHFYRIFALNQFMKFGNSEETFKDFSDKNRKAIMNLLVEFKLPRYGTFSEELLDEYRSSIVELKNRKSFNDGFESLTKEEIIKTWENRKKIGKVVENNCLDRLKEAKRILSFKDDIDFLGESEEKLMKAFFNSIVSDLSIYRSGISVSRITNEYSNFVSAFIQKTSVRKGDVEYYDNHPLKYEIATKLFEISEKVTPVDLISVMFAMGSTASIFRSSNSHKAMEAVKTGLFSHDPVSFVKLISEVMFNYDGPYATAAEWIENITNIKELDFELGAVISMQLFIDGNKISPKKDVKIDKNERFKSRYSGRI